MKRRLFLPLVLVAGIATLVACPDGTSTGPGDPVPPAAPPPSPLVTDPIVTSIEPASVEPGQDVIISGSNFGTDRRRLRVTFGGTEAFVRFVSDSSITAQVPFLVGLGTIPVLVSVTGAAHAATISLEVRPGPPVIHSLRPFPAADPGETVAIIGRNFGSEKDQVTVTFDSLPASVLSVTNTQIDVVVPVATRPGDAQVVVTVGDRSSPPRLFKIRPPSPSISAVGPSVALRGSDIVIFGSHFGTDPNSLSVQFCRSTGGFYYYYGDDECHTASISAVSDTRLTVQVPADLPADNWEIVLTVTDARLPATATVQIL